MGNFNFFMARTGKKIVKEIEYGVVVCETWYFVFVSCIAA